MLTRNVELYFGFGDDSGTWSTDYVEIPYDTPESSIASIAIEEATKNGGGYAFVGLYSIPSLDDEINEIEDKLGDIINIGDTVDCDSTKENLEFRGTIIGISCNYLIVEDENKKGSLFYPKQLRKVD